MPIDTLIVRVTQADDNSPVIATTITATVPLQVITAAPSAGQAGAGRTATDALRALAAALEAGIVPAPVVGAPAPAGAVQTAPDGSTTAAPA